MISHFFTAPFMLQTVKTADCPVFLKADSQKSPSPHDTQPRGGWGLFSPISFTCRVYSFS